MALGIGLGSIIGAGVSGALGIAGESIANKRAFSQQKELMELQQQNQMKLNKQGQQIQMENWKNTNYPAQMRMLKEAGLSAGLMYGQNGGGGTTTGSQGGGSAASGNAPKPMDIGNMVQAALMGSQVEVNKAQAKKLEAEAASTKGEAGTTGAAQIALAEYKRMTEIQKGLTEEENTRIAAETVRKIKLENDINQETKEEAIQSIIEDLVQKRIDTKLKRNNKKLTDKEIETFREQLNQKWLSAGSGAVGKIIKK